MKKVFIALLLLCSIIQNGISQHLEYESVTKLPGWRGFNIKATENSKYVTGRYKSSAEFNTDTLNYNNNGNGLFLVKYDSLDNEVWIKEYGFCQQYQRISEITLDQNENIYFGSHYRGQALMTDTIIGTPSSCGSSGELILAKYNSGGDLLWVFNCGGNGGGRILRLETDPQDNLIVGGTASSGCTINGQTISTESSAANFVAKFDGNAQLLWSHSLGYLTGYRPEMGLDVDDNGNVYAVSQYTYNYNFDMDAIIAADNNNASIVKFDSSGNPIWHKEIYGDAFELTDIKAFNQQIYVVGEYIGELTYDNDTLNATDVDGLLFAINSSTGDINWVKELGGSGSDQYLNRIDADEFGNLYIGGSSNPDSQVDTTDSPCILCFTLYCLDYKGNVIEILTDNSGSSYYKTITSVDVLDADHVYITGELHGSGTLDNVNFSFGDDFDLFMATINTDSIGANIQDSLEVSVDQAQGCTPLSINIMESSGQPILNYEWDLGDTVIITTLNPITNIYENAGLYPIGLTTTDIHGNVDSITVNDAIEVLNSATPTIELTPDCIIILPETPCGVVIQGSLQDYTIDILDANGSVYQNLNTASLVSLNIDPSTLPFGAYFIRLVNINNGQIWVEKFIKQQ